MNSLARLRAGFFLALMAILVAVAASLVWLRWEAGQPRERWFTERQGEVRSVSVEPVIAGQGQAAQSVQLESDSGLQIFLRVIRDTVHDEPLPVLVVLGGHRTGSAAVELFGEVGERAVVALDYPYDGPERIRGLSQFGQALPQIRQAFLDTPPAVSLVVDWLIEQPWVDRGQILMVGVSLGVPFATTAAARDERLSGLLLVHGAADNRLWLEQNLSRRLDAGFLQPALATVLHWFVYGPLFDTEEQVAAVSPRPVLVVGARDDERTPEGQTMVLFEAAREPKMLRWTEGQHVGPGRGDIIDDLLRIADDVRPFFVPQ
ncbi:MAG: hypothetical protein WD448_11455 [Woeseia sp.]